MVIRELTYQLHKLEASESALVSADHHDKKSVLGIGGKNPDRSIPKNNYIVTFSKKMTVGLAYANVTIMPANCCCLIKLSYKRT